MTAEQWLVGVLMSEMRTVPYYCEYVDILWCGRWCQCQWRWCNNLMKTGCEKGFKTMALFSLKTHHSPLCQCGAGWKCQLWIATCDDAIIWSGKTGCEKKRQWRPFKMLHTVHHVNVNVTQFVKWRWHTKVFFQETCFYDQKAWAVLDSW